MKARDECGIFTCIRVHSSKGRRTCIIMTKEHGTINIKIAQANYRCAVMILPLWLVGVASYSQRLSKNGQTEKNGTHVKSRHTSR